MLIIIALIGFAVMTMGRQMFWIFVAGLGFILGFTYAGMYYSGQPPWILLTIGLITGAVGALLAYLMQKIAAGVAGFLAGWYLVLTLLSYVHINISPTVEQLLPIIGGVIGAGLIAVLFDWSLIVISSMAGATMIVQILNFNNQILLGIFIVLTILGISIQAIFYSQDTHQKNR